MVVGRDHFNAPDVRALLHGDVAERVAKIDAQAGLVGQRLEVGMVEQHERPQFPGVQRRAAPAAAGQRWVGHRAPAQHHPGQTGKPGGDAAEVRRGKNVAVIAQGIPAARPGRRESAHIRRIFVEVPPHPGVDDERTDGVLVVDLQQPPEFPGALHTDAGLDRHGHGRLGKDLLQKGVQRLRYGEKPGPPFFGRHRARGTAQIEIDLGIAHEKFRKTKVLRNFYRSPRKKFASSAAQSSASTPP